MFNLLKLIIIFISCSYLYNSYNNFYLYSLKQNNSNLLKHNKNCKHSYEYSRIEKIPTKEENGIKMNMCKYCRKKYFETIPKLNQKNYNIENLTSNCENGNGIRYFSELYGSYELTDNKTELHSIYGKKCNKCHKLIGEFDFKSLGSLKCTGYPRLIRLSNAWNNNWLLGGNFGNNV